MLGYKLMLLCFLSAVFIMVIIDYAKATNREGRRALQFFIGATSVAIGMAVAWLVL